MTSDGYKKVTRIGGFFTVLFLSNCVGVPHVRWEEFLALELNEIGDLLAGVVGPVALMWVVLGYFQQGHELREATKQNTALTKVGEDQLVEAQKAQKLIQTRHDASFEPVFAFLLTQRTVKNNKIIFDFNLINIGKSVGNVGIAMRYINSNVVFQNPEFATATPKLKGPFSQAKLSKKLELS